MPCCGSQRMQAGGIAPAGQTAGTRSVIRRETIIFEYLGETALTVIGHASGRRYRFDGHGARQAIDPRDRTAMMQIGKLRQVG